MAPCPECALLFGRANAVRAHAAAVRAYHGRYSLRHHHNLVRRFERQLRQLRGGWRASAWSIMKRLGRWLATVSVYVVTSLGMLAMMQLISGWISHARHLVELAQQAIPAGAKLTSILQNSPAAASKWTVGGVNFAGMKGFRALAGAFKFVSTTSNSEWALHKGLLKHMPPNAQNALYERSMDNMIAIHKAWDDWKLRHPLQVNPELEEAATSAFKLVQKARHPAGDAASAFSLDKKAALEIQRQVAETGRQQARYYHDKVGRFELAKTRLQMKEHLYYALHQVFAGAVLSMGMQAGADALGAVAKKLLNLASADYRREKQRRRGLGLRDPPNEAIFSARWIGGAIGFGFVILFVNPVGGVVHMVTIAVALVVFVVLEMMRRIKGIAESAPQLLLEFARGLRK